MQVGERYYYSIMLICFFKMKIDTSQTIIVL